MAAHDLDPLFPPRPRRRLWHRLTLWLARRRQERRMEMLRRDPALACDLGLTPGPAPRIPDWRARW